jgi:hypothetical protein
MTRLGAPSTEKDGVCLELTSNGRRVALRGWHRYGNIEPHFFTLEEFAARLGLIVPPPKPRNPHRSFPKAVQPGRDGEIFPGNNREEAM